MSDGTPSATPLTARTWTGGAETTPVRVPAAGGSALVFTARSPDSDGPGEDAVAVLPYGPDSSAIVVADGLGGERCGTSAARLVIESLARALEQGLREALRLRAAVLNGIEAANLAVRALGSGAASTVAVLQIREHCVRPFHVGDSSILIVGQRGRIKHQNVPHGPVGYAVEAGLLSESQAMRHPERNVVSNVIGTVEMRIEVGPALDLARRDTALVASDGLTDNLFAEEIVALVRAGPLERAARRLAESCRERMLSPRGGAPSKPDDLSFVLYRRDR